VRIFRDHFGDLLAQEWADRAQLQAALDERAAALLVLDPAYFKGNLHGPGARAHPARPQGPAPARRARRFGLPERPACPLVAGRQRRPPPHRGLRRPGGRPVSVARTKVDLDATTQRCTTLGLTHAAKCLGELVEEASREDLSPLGFFDRMLEKVRWHVGAEGTCPRFPRWFNFEPSRMGYPRGLGAVPLPAFAAAVDDLRPVRGRRCVTPEARDGSILNHLAGPRISAAPGRGYDEPVGGGRASRCRGTAATAPADGPSQADIRLPGQSRESNGAPRHPAPGSRAPAASPRRRRALHQPRSPSPSRPHRPDATLIGCGSRPRAGYAQT